MSWADRYDVEPVRQALARRLHRSVFATEDEALSAVAVAWACERDQFAVQIRAGNILQFLYVPTRGHALLADGSIFDIDTFIERVWSSQ